MDSGLTGLTRSGRKLVPMLGPKREDSRGVKTGWDRFFEALGELPEGAFPIHLHHSDCGCRYCPRRYAEKARARGLATSGHEEPRCYENARANG